MRNVYVCWQYDFSRLVCGVIPIPQSPETQHRHRQKLRAECRHRCADVSTLSADIVAPNGKCFMMFHNVLIVLHDVLQVVHDVLLVVHDVLLLVHDVLRVFHDVLQCFTMFYDV